MMASEHGMKKRGPRHPEWPWRAQGSTGIMFGRQAANQMDMTAKIAMPRTNMRRRPNKSPAPPPVKKKRRKAKRIGIDEPLDDHDGSRQIGLDGRQRNIDDGLVDIGDAGREDRYGKHPRLGARGAIAGRTD